MTEEEIQFERALRELADKCAEFVIKKGTGKLIDIEEFIVRFMISFNIDFYEGVGILEEAKNVYRDIILNKDDVEENENE